MALDDIGDLDMEFESALGLGLDDDLPAEGRGSRRKSDITKNREGNFSRESARFHDPDTGEFEAGSPPPDLDTDVDRYRAVDGKFKSRSADLFDEPEEVRLGSLDPEG